MLQTWSLIFFNYQILKNSYCKHHIIATVNYLLYILQSDKNSILKEISGIVYLKTLSLNSVAISNKRTQIIAQIQFHFYKEKTEIKLWF
jgi:hypothetical protein